jgi:hypothetical protein
MEEDLLPYVFKIFNKIWKNSYDSDSPYIDFQLNLEKITKWTDSDISDIFLKFLERNPNISIEYLKQVLIELARNIYTNPMIFHKYEKDIFLGLIKKSLDTIDSKSIQEIRKKEYENNQAKIDWISITDCTTEKTVFNPKYSESNEKINSESNIESNIKGNEKINSESNIKGNEKSNTKSNEKINSESNDQNNEKSNTKSNEKINSESNDQNNEKSNANSNDIIFTEDNKEKIISRQNCTTNYSKAPILHKNNDSVYKINDDKNFQKVKSYNNIPSINREIKKVALKKANLKIDVNTKKHFYENSIKTYDDNQSNKSSKTFSTDFLNTIEFNKSSSSNNKENSSNKINIKNDTKINSKINNSNKMNFF